MIQGNVISLKPAETSESFTDALTVVLQQGARKLIFQAVEEELKGFLDQHKDLKDEQGRQAVVRNGYLPERTVMTGIGAVEVKVPKVRDRSRQGIKFNSTLLPPYLKRSRSVEAVLPWLYLKGVSTGDFAEALSALLGSEAEGLSPATISRLKAKWVAEHKSWLQRSLLGKHYIYVWADGIYFNIRNDDDRQCILVMIGVTETGHKELLALEAGVRESELTWKNMLLRLVAQGLSKAPQLAVACLCEARIGDGSLGFWKALSQIFPSTRHQRCWVHKTANILDKLPKSQQPQAKSALQEIYLAATRQEANVAFDRFLKTYEDKYPQVAHCLDKDRDTLLAFYDFPAAHWIHIRTTNPIESTFATVRLRTDKTRGCVSKESILSFVFKLVQNAEKTWLRIRGFKQIGEVIEGVQFRDGVRVDQPIQDAA